MTISKARLAKSEAQHKIPEGNTSTLQNVKRTTTVALATFVAASGISAISPSVAMGAARTSGTGGTPAPVSHASQEYKNTGGTPGPNKKQIHSKNAKAPKAGQEYKNTGGTIGPSNK
ncbi:MAG: hypothetical protein KGH67_05530 [Candidatus Micrarchaeota archaeon]|nr:hypothetical protein [Candidatus Micrarchaeota archaeon]